MVIKSTMGTVVLGLPLLCAQVHANPIQWAAPVDGIYNEGSSWTGGVAPGEDDTAVFDNGSQAPYTATLSSGITNKALEVRSDTVVLDLAGYTATFKSLDFTGGVLSVGNAAGDIGNLEMMNGSFVADNIDSGTFSVEIGTQSDSHGELTLRNVIFDNITTPPDLSVGGSSSSGATMGTGELNMLGGSQYTGHGSFIINEGGTVNVNGYGSSLSSESIFVNGLLVVDGGAAIQNFGSSINILEAGDVLITGNGTSFFLRPTISGGLMQITNGSTGQFFGETFIDNGGVLQVDDAHVEHRASSDAVITDGLLQISNGGVFDSNHIFPEINLGGRIVVYDEGEVNLDYGKIAADNVEGVILDGGKLSGHGIVDGNLKNLNGGTVSPGPSSGSILVTGDYTQDVASKLMIELGGLSPVDEYDVLSIEGDAYLDGILDVSFLNLGTGEFSPGLGDSFDILVADEINGEFDILTLAILSNGLDWDVSYILDDLGADFVRLSVVNAIPVPASAWLLGSGLIGLIGIARRKKA